MPLPHSSSLTCWSPAQDGEAPGYVDRFSDAVADLQKVAEEEGPARRGG